MKTILFISSILLLSATACSNDAEKQAEKTQDSIENVELDKVDEIRQNEDSLLKAKEAELMEQYK